MSRNTRVPEQRQAGMLDGSPAPAPGAKPVRMVRTVIIGCLAVALASDVYVFHHFNRTAHELRHVLHEGTDQAIAAYRQGMRTWWMWASISWVALDVSLLLVSGAVVGASATAGLGTFMLAGACVAGRFLLRGLVYWWFKGTWWIIGIYDAGWNDRAFEAVFYTGVLSGVAAVAHRIGRGSWPPVRGTWDRLGHGLRLPGQRTWDRLPERVRVATGFVAALAALLGGLAKLLEIFARLMGK